MVNGKYRFTCVYFFLFCFQDFLTDFYLFAVLLFLSRFRYTVLFSSHGAWQCSSSVSLSVAKAAFKMSQINGCQRLEIAPVVSSPIRMHVLNIECLWFRFSNFARLSAWWQIRKHCPNAPILLVGNKADLRTDHRAHERLIQKGARLLCDSRKSVWDCPKGKNWKCNSKIVWP